MTIYEFERFIQEYNKKHTEFHIDDEEYHENFSSRPILNSRHVCIGHVKRIFDGSVIVRHYSSIPKIREEMLNFLEDFKFKRLFFIPCENTQLYVYVARIEGLK